MPHTNRKKKTGGDGPKSKPLQTKRRIAEDDEGWSHVVRTAAKAHEPHAHAKPHVHHNAPAATGEDDDLRLAGADFKR